MPFKQADNLVLSHSMDTEGVRFVKNNCILLNALA